MSTAVSALLLLWILLADVDLLDSSPQIQNFYIRTASHVDSGSPHTITLTLWFNDKIYQCDIVPVSIDSMYGCDSNSYTTISQCGPPEYKVMIEVPGTNAPIFSSISMFDFDGTWYGIDSWCIPDSIVAATRYKNTPSWIITSNHTLCVTNTSLYSNICIDTQSNDCGPSKQIIHFYTNKSNQYQHASLWTDATNLIVDTFRCPTNSPSFYPTYVTLYPSSNPSVSPSSNPSFSPSFYPSNKPTTNSKPMMAPTAFPVLSPVEDGAVIVYSSTGFFEIDEISTDDIGKTDSSATMMIIIILAILVCVLCVVIAIILIWVNRKLKVSNDDTQNTSEVTNITGVEMKKIVSVSVVTKDEMFTPTTDVPGNIHNDDDIVRFVNTAGSNPTNDKDIVEFVNDNITVDDVPTIEGLNEDANLSTEYTYHKPTVTQDENVQTAH